MRKTQQTTTNIKYTIYSSNYKRIFLVCMIVSALFAYIGYSIGDTTGFMRGLHDGSAEMLKQAVVYDRPIEFIGEYIGNKTAYCWTDFMGKDGIGFGIRVWNLNVSPNHLSDCEILQEECIDFMNKSDTFQCRWLTKENTCECRLREPFSSRQ